MAKLTSKGRGRPRKALPDDRGNRQAEGDNANGIGDGSVSASELTTQADAIGTGERCNYAELVDLIKKNNHKNTDLVIVRAWHPDAKGLTIETNQTDVVIEKGEASYQYTNGEIITI